MDLESSESMQGIDSHGSCNGNACSSAIGVETVEEHRGPEEEEPLIQSSECRICQEEDSPKNLEVPCACTGSLEFAHRKCVQRWCNEKGDTICEICSQTFQPGYTVPPPRSPSEDVAIDISDSWTISGTPLDMHDPRLLAVGAADRHFLEADYDDYADPNASGTSFCRAAALILMALLFLRHALALPDSDEDDDASTFFSIFLLRAAGFLLPCYIMAWAVSILQRRRQRQESAEEVAVMIRAGQRSGLQFTISPAPTATTHQEPLQ